MTAKMGRPRIDIPWGLVDELCGIRATLSEIAGVTGISEDTLERACKRDKNTTFADYYEAKSANGKISLRRAQLQTALAGSVPMLIWLGKNWLNQTDKTPEERPDESAIVDNLRRVADALESRDG